MKWPFGHRGCGALAAIFLGMGLSGLPACGAAEADGLAPLNGPELAATFEDLHRLTYGAPRDLTAPGAEDALHDELAQTYIGEALTTAYVDHVLMDAALRAQGAWVEIADVTYLAVHPIEGEAGWVEATWQVSGEVRHVRHRHGRVNRYRGRFYVVQGPEGPRIAAVRVGDVGGTILPAGVLEGMGPGERRSPSELLRAQEGGP